MPLFNRRRFAGIFILIFAAGVLPLLAAHASALAGAGLSAGFLRPLEPLFHPVLFLLVGVCAVFLKRMAVVMLPLCFMTMLLIGAILRLEEGVLPHAQIFMCVAIVLFVLCMSLAYGRAFLVAAACFSSFAFHLGGYYMVDIPPLAPPLYYLMGVMAGVLLLLATGVSIGLALPEDLEPLWQRLRRIPSIASLLSFF